MVQICDLELVLEHLAESLLLVRFIVVQGNEELLLGVRLHPPASCVGLVPLCLVLAYGHDGGVVQQVQAQNFVKLKVF